MNHFSYYAKMTLIMYPKISPTLKEKFIRCRNVVPTRLSAMELWGTGVLQEVLGQHVRANQLKTTWQVVPCHPLIFPPWNHHSQKVNVVGLHQIN